jgi:hypothetical protein
MQVKTSVFLTEEDIRMIVKKHLEKEGFIQVGEVEILTRANPEMVKKLPKGDIVGINAEVRKGIMKNIKLPNNK